MFTRVWLSSSILSNKFRFHQNVSSHKLFQCNETCFSMQTPNVSAVDSVYILEKGVSWSKMIRNSILVPTFLIFFETVCTIRWYFLHLCYIVYFLITTWTIYECKIFQIKKFYNFCSKLTSINTVCLKLLFHFCFSRTTSYYT